MPGQRESSTTMHVAPVEEARMRGDDDRQQPEMWSYVPLVQRVPHDHPLRAMRTMVDAILAELSPAFDEIYSRVGRPSIAPERLLRALLLQALYSVRSERLLMEHLDFNLLFRWFVGLAMDDPIWDATVFTKNRERLLAGDIARKFFDQVRAEAAKRELLSNEHFTVDGTLIEAWAGLKSFQRKDTPRQPPDDPGNPTVNFHGEQRSNATHASTTDPEARLARKGKAHEAKLCYQGHVLMENRHGLAVDARLTPATGYAEREAALAMAAAIAGVRRVTLGADKGYDADEGEAVRLCPLDHGACRIVHAQHAALVATVEQHRHARLLERAHRAARRLEAGVLGDVEQFRQTGVLVAAQRRVEHVIGEDMGFLGLVPDPAHGTLGQRAGFGDAQVDTFGRTGAHGSLSRGATALPGRLRAFGGLGEPVARPPILVRIADRRR